jgi:methyl-accepting chemotaxis protein
MSFLNNIKLGKKITFGFLIVCVIALVIGIVGSVRLKQIDDQYTQLMNESILRTIAIGNATEAFEKSSVDIRDYLMSIYTNRKNEYETDLLANMDMLLDNINLAESYTKNAGLLQALDDMKDMAEEFVALRKQSVEMEKAGRHQEAI